MKTLSNAAVFGLLPVPYAAATRNGDEVVTAAEEIGDALLRACRQHATSERMATKEELARICSELGHVAPAASRRARPFACTASRQGRQGADRHRE